MNVVGENAEPKHPSKRFFSVLVVTGAAQTLEPESQPLPLYLFTRKRRPDGGKRKSKPLLSSLPRLHFPGSTEVSALETKISQTQDKQPASGAEPVGGSESEQASSPSLLSNGEEITDSDDLDFLFCD